MILNGTIKTSSKYTLVEKGCKSKRDKTKKEKQNHTQIKLCLLLIP